MKRVWAAIVVCAVAVTVAACGSDSTDEPAATSAAQATTAAAATAATSPSAPGSATPTATRPTATNTTAPSPSPTAVPAKPATEGPRVLWMLQFHSGAGVVTIRLATDVDTTAVLRAAQVPGQSQGIPEQKSEKLAKEHGISIAAGARAAYEVEVTDAQGRKGVGVLEINEVTGTQYWGRLEFAPKVTVTGGDAVATWRNLKTTNAEAKGKVWVFARPAGCTTAQACEAKLLASYANDTVGGDASGETHSVPIKVPTETTVSALVIFAGGPFPTANQGIRSHFFQLTLNPGR